MGLALNSQQPSLTAILQTSVTVLAVEASPGTVSISYLLEFPVADVSVHLSSDTLDSTVFGEQLQLLSQDSNATSFDSALTSLMGGVVRDTYGNDITGQATVSSGASAGTSSLSDGAIAGIVIGAIVLVLLLVGVIALVASVRQEQRGSWDRNTFRFGPDGKPDPYQQTIRASNSGSIRILHVERSLPDQTEP